MIDAPRAAAGAAGSSRSRGQQPEPRAAARAAGSSASRERGDSVEPAMRPVPLAGEAPAVAEILPLPPRRAEPPELLEPGLRNHHAVLGRPEASQRAVQQGLVPMFAERRRQDRRAAQRRDLPRARLLGDPLEA